MANEVSLYNFYYRYRWTDTDFRQWQQAMIEHARAMFEGLFNSAVMVGMDVDPGSGLSVDISSGIASGPSGYLHAPQSASGVSLTAPTGTDPVRVLIVAQPDLEDEDYITRPTNPFDIVPLRVRQATQYAAIYGTPAPSPIYPSKGVNDVILAGLQVDSGATGFVPGDIDYGVREVIGKNSFLNFHPAFTINLAAANYQPTVNQEIVFAGSGAGAITITLPDATLNAGYSFTVKKVTSDANAVIVQSLIGGQQVERSASHQLTEENQFATYASNGVDWFIISAG